MNRKLLIFIFLLLTNSNTIFAQSNSDLKTELENKINSSWTVELDTNVSDSINGSVLLQNGDFEGYVILSNKNNTFKFLLYSSETDSIFSNEIGIYIDHASCVASKKYQPNTFYYKTGTRYLFLPMYPCWTNGYSKKSKKQIINIYGKAEKRKNGR